MDLDNEFDTLDVLNVDLEKWPSAEDKCCTRFALMTWNEDKWELGYGPCLAQSP